MLIPVRILESPRIQLSSELDQPCLILMHLAQADDRLVSETLFALYLVLRVEPAARDLIVLARILLNVHLALSYVSR